MFLGGIFVWLIVHRGMHHNSPPPQPSLPTLDLGNCLRPPTLGTLPTLLQILKEEYPIIVFPLQGLANIYHLILVVAIIPLIMVQWIPFVQRGDKFRWNWNFRFGGNCEAGNCQIPPGSHQKWPGLKNGVLAKKHVWKRAGFSKFFLHWSETISFQHEWNGGLYCGVIYSHCCPGFVQWCFIWRWHNIEMAWALNLTSTVSQLPWLKNFFNSRCRPGPCACQSNALSLNVELLNRSLLQMTPHFIPHGPVQWAIGIIPTMFELCRVDEMCRLFVFIETPCMYTLSARHFQLIHPFVINVESLIDNEHHLQGDSSWMSPSRTSSKLEIDVQLILDIYQLYQGTKPQYEARWWYLKPEELCFSSACCEPGAYFGKSLQV